MSSPFRKVLSIDENNWKRLSKIAKGFETPNQVITRVLDELDEFKGLYKTIIEGEDNDTTRES